MSSAERLRQLPSVDGILRSEELADVRATCAHSQLLGWVRSAVTECRARIRLGAEPAIDDARRFILQRVIRLAASDEGQVQRQVINATGILLHTNLGRAPLADRAITRMNDAVGYASVELNLESGRRSRRGERVSRLLATLTGADDALVVNNCAAATMLVLQGLAAGREVVISRGQLVEIGGGFRLPDVFQAAGVTLQEVGTTNRTYLHDYERAICENTGAVIRVHRSNFRQTGFVTEPSIQELVTMQRPASLPLIDDLGSGCLYNLRDFGIQEPTVGESIQAGADLALFSGDKLFGGPQAGIIVGRQAWINRLRVSPLMRAMRVDKLTLAALEATTEIHLGGTAFAELPLLMMLTKDVATLQRDCDDVIRQLASHCGTDVSIQTVNCEAEIGGGSVPGVAIPGYAVRICGGANFDVEQLAKRLRSGTPAVVARICSDGLMLDLRTVADAERPMLVDKLRRSLSENET